MRRLLLLLAMLAAPAQARTVTATVYDGWYNGRADACGGHYEHWGVSAAHPWLPCGTKVTVTHGGRSLVVRIWDRCDCNSIDLSAGAAHRLHFPLDGTAKVGILLLMTDLSPSAQAVIDAYEASTDKFKALAAVICAAADQRNDLEVPFNLVDDWEKMKGSCAKFYAAAEWGYNQALAAQCAIVTELEGHD